MGKFIKIGGGLLAALVVIAGVAYTQIFGFTQSQKIGDKVFLVYNSGGLSRIGANVVAIDAGDAWVVFDTHLGPLARGAVKKIKSIKNAPITLAFNSHWHPDHSGGNAVFTEKATIVAHENVLRTLSRPHEGVGLTKPGAYKLYDAVDAPGLPETVIQDRQEFHVGELQFEAVHYPAAHTDGDVVLFVPALKLVALGDLIWPAGFPFVDVTSGGSAKGVSSALKDILERTSGSYKYVMGHGEPFAADQVREYILMVDETIGFVERKKATGETLETIQAGGLPEKWRSWETNLNPQEEWIRMIFESL